MGEYIICGKNGVCRVERIFNRANGSGRQPTAYYQLAAVFETGDEKIFLPVENSAVQLRRVITGEEAAHYLEQLPGMHPQPVYSHRQAPLVEHYQQLSDSASPDKMLYLLKECYLKQEQAREHKKKLGLVDQRYLRLAERLVYGEFSVALGVPVEQVKEDVMKRIFS